MAYVSLDSDQIKKAHKKHKYTKEQVEQLEKCRDQKTGPLYFMKQFMKIQHPTKGEMKFNEAVGNIKKWLAEGSPTQNNYAEFTV